MPSGTPPSANEQHENASVNFSLHGEATFHLRPRLPFRGSAVRRHRQGREPGFARPGAGHRSSTAALVLGYRDEKLVEDDGGLEISKEMNGGGLRKILRFFLPRLLLPRWSG